MLRNRFLFALLAGLALACSAAGQASGPIPIWLGGTKFVPSNLYQDGSQLNVSGSINAYDISAGEIASERLTATDIEGRAHISTPVLDVYVINSVYDINSGAYKINGENALSHDYFSLRVGRGAGGDAAPGERSTFVGENAGHHTGGMGIENTFVGNNAGVTNTDGQSNTFMGARAGNNNSTGSSNAFTGAYAGFENTTGSGNAFYGYSAGMYNGDGGANVFVGNFAGANNGAGNANTILGSGAGAHSFGSGNIFVGAGAGVNNNDGNNDIYIGHSGPGQGNESNTIRIGATQKVAYIAGIYGSLASGGVPVTINAHGQLGTVSSSLRFKEHIRDMGDSTNALMRLRPVTFLYKPEYDQGDRTLQYGLIAEEVAKVYPELVAYDDAGQPYTIRYQYLTTMLLNEVQKQHHRAEAQAQVIEQLEERVSRLEKLLGGQLPTVAQK